MLLCPLSSFMNSFHRTKPHQPYDPEPDSFQTLCSYFPILDHYHFFSLHVYVYASKRV